MHASLELDATAMVGAFRCKRSAYSIRASAVWQYSDSDASGANHHVKQSQMLALFVRQCIAVGFPLCHERNGPHSLLLVLASYFLLARNDIRLVVAWHQMLVTQRCLSRDVAAL